MPGGRPAIDLSERRDWITERVGNGVTQDEIRHELNEHHGVKIGRSKLMQQLSEWKITAKRPAYKDTEELRERLLHCFSVLRLTDEKTQQVLEAEGFNIGSKRVARLRKNMGLLKRIQAEDRDNAEALIAKCLHQELKEGTNIRDLGRKQLYKLIRSKYNVTGRDRIYKVANLFDPTGPSRRRVQNGRATSQRRGPKPVPEANSGGADISGDVSSSLVVAFDAQVVAALDTPADNEPPSAHFQ